MSKKFIISFIVIFIAVIGIVIIYSYNQVSDPGMQTNTNNIQKQTPIATGPSIKVEPESFDLGVVVYGEVAEHVFKVQNVGSEPLEILRLSTSCGCTKAFMDESDRTIAPGQTVDMLVTFDPAVHKDDTDLGELTRIIYIKNNDLQMPEKEVVITANVIKNN